MKKGRHVNGQPLTNPEGFPSNGMEYMMFVRFVIWKDIRRWFRQLSPDGQTVVDELRRDISTRAEEAWRLLNEDDRATIVRFINDWRQSGDKWVWVTMRQPHDSYTNSLTWHQRHIDP